MLSQKEFDLIYSRVPRLCVDIVIKNKSGVLLAKRAIEPYKEWWHLPGGTVFIHEKIEDAAKRVIKRELNVNIKIIKKIDYLGGPTTEINHHDFSVVLLAKIISGKIRLNEESEEFIITKKIPKKTLAGHANLFKKYPEILK